MPVDSAYDEKYKYRKMQGTKCMLRTSTKNRESEYLKIVTFVSNYEKRLAIREIKGTIIS
jgi:hypothetical protein